MKPRTPLPFCPIRFYTRAMATLLGPPEIYTLQSTTQIGAAAATPATPIPAAPTTTTPSNPFNSLATTTTPPPQSYPPMGLTENNSPTFLSTGNPCLDFFFHVVPDTPPDTLLHRLDLSWSHQPLTTLKLVCNLRGVRGTGKSDREGFYSAALWLHHHHPITLASNVPSLADFGYFRDLPEILYRLLEGSGARQIQKQEWLKIKRGGAFLNGVGIRFTNRKWNRKKDKDNTEKKESLMARAKAEKERAHALKVQKRVAMAKKLVDRYNTDPIFRFLNDSVSDHFAECLKRDLEFLRSGSLTKISLAAKWCPSVDSSFDRSTLLCESIARRVFPREGEEYEGVEEAHYAYRIRDRLRKEVLVPLRKVLQLPEVFIGANRWDLIPYNRVASVAMKIYKKKFLKLRM